MKDNDKTTTADLLDFCGGFLAIPLLVIPLNIAFHGHNDLENHLKTKISITNAFYKAGVPYEQKDAIHRALFELNGDCRSAQEGFEKFCEQMKTDLGLVYEAPPPPSLTTNISRPTGP